MGNEASVELPKYPRFTETISLPRSPVIFNENITKFFQKRFDGREVLMKDSHCFIMQYLREFNVAEQLSILDDLVDEGFILQSTTGPIDIRRRIKKEDYVSCISYTGRLMALVWGNGVKPGSLAWRIAQIQQALDAIYIRSIELYFDNALSSTIVADQLRGDRKFISVTAPTKFKEYWNSYCFGEDRFKRKINSYMHSKGYVIVDVCRKSGDGSNQITLKVVPLRQIYVVEPEVLYQKAQPKASAESPVPETQPATQERELDPECVICKDNVCKNVISSCGHQICESAECVDYVRTKGICPICRGVVREIIRRRP